MRNLSRVALGALLSMTMVVCSMPAAYAEQATGTSTSESATEGQTLEPQATGTIDVTGKSSITIFADHYVVDSVYYTSWSGDVTLTGTGDCTVALNIGTGETAKKVILSNLTLSGDNSTIACAYDGARIWLAAGTVNTVTSTKSGVAAIDSGSSSLVIGGEGTLNATGADYAAGIGRGQYADKTSYITIEGGTINAGGGWEAAGIGGGDSNTGSMYVTISGGTVRAAGGNGGAGIGGGYKASGLAMVYITGGTIVNATSVKYGAGIGGGQYATAPVYVTISGGTIGGRDEKGTDYGPTGGYEAAGIGGGDSSTGATTIDISGGTVAYALGGDGGAGIGAGYKAAGKTTVQMTGGNVGGSQIQGGKYGAAIGGGQYVTGDVQIDLSGGTIGKALGGYEGAGIGGGDSSSAGALNISIGGTSSIGGTYSNTKYVVGGDYAAGIGSGYKGRIDKISIGDNCSVQGVWSAPKAAAIGVGDRGSGEPTSNTVTIDISGGTVSSESYDSDELLGADTGDCSAIGSGVECGSSLAVTISGGDVTARSESNRAAAIGLNCDLGTHSMSLAITGGTVHATATAYDANAIGCDELPCTITISGGTVEAESTGAGSEGIGGAQSYFHTYDRSITISGGTVTGKGGTIGIGGWGSKVTISGGDVTGLGGTSTGIGGTGGTVDISGGTVTGRGDVFGKVSAAGIGTSECTVGISGGTVDAFGGTGRPGIESRVKAGEQKNMVSISGGQVYAKGQGAAGIGIDPFDNTNMCPIDISGGTVWVQGGAGHSAIDSGESSVLLSTVPAVTITGGNVMAVNGTDYTGQEIVPTPTNEDVGKGEKVACALLTVPLVSTSSAEQRVTTLSYYLGESTAYEYGTKDVYTLNGGKVYAYLPLKSSALTQNYTATANTEDRANAHLSPLNYTLHPVSVGTTAFQNYIFDSNKLTPTAKDFQFTVDGESGSPTHSGGETATIPYDGAMHTTEVSVVNGIDGMGSIVVKYKAEGSETYTYTSPQNAGTYGVYVDLGNGASYDAVRNLQVGKITINRAQNSVTVTGYDGTYDGQEHTVGASALPGSTLYYSATGGTDATDWSTTPVSFWRSTLDGSGNVVAKTVYVKATNPNCEDGYGQATVTISKRPVTIAASSATVAYNGTEQSIFGGTYQGCIAADDLVHDPATMPYECKGTNVGSYDGKLTGDMTVKVKATTAHAGAAVGDDVTDCYGISLVPGTLTITQAPVTVTANDKSMVVGGTEPTLDATVTGTFGSDKLTYTLTREAGTTAGTYAITSAGDASQGNYAVTYKPGTLTISAAADYVSAIGYAGVYDGDPHSITATAHGAVTDLKYSTDQTNWKADIKDVSFTDAGTHTVYVKGTLNGVDTTPVSATVTIDPDPILANVSIDPQTYTSKALTPEATVSYTEGSQTITLTEGTDYEISYADNVNVGTASCTVTLKGNYEGATTAHFVIKPMPIDVPAVASGLTYDGTLQPGVVLAAGTDEHASLSGDASETDAGTYTATATLKDAANTAWADGTTADKVCTWTIARAATTENAVTATGYSSTYDGKAHGVTASSVVTGGTTLYYSADNVNWSTESPTWTNAELDAQGTAVSHTVYVKAVNPNYEDATAEATIAISKASLTATYKGETVGYGDTPAYAVDVTGFMNGETAGGAAGYVAPTVTGGPTIPAPVGTSETLTPSGGSATNYDFSYVSGTLTITPKAVTVTADAASKGYGSSDPVLTASVTGTVGSDTVTYTPPSRVQGESVGDYAITVSGAASQGNYAVTYVGATFTINPSDASGAMVTGIDPSYTFTGSEIKPAPTVTIKDSTTTLTEGTDYEVKYQDNVELGTASYTIEYKGNYTGASTGTFKITAADASDFVAAIPPQAYTGSAIEPDPTVIFNGNILLEKGVDYDVTYESNVDVGTATAHIAFKGDFTGSRDCTFQIDPLPVAVPAYKASLPYDGSIQTSVSANSGDRYSVSGGSATNAGSYVAVVSLKDKKNTVWADESTNDLSYKWEITPANASGAAVSGVELAYTYTGSAITPAPVVTLGEKTLVAGTDYDVTYSDNTDPGTATYTVTFKGNYTGTATGTFAITARREAALVDGTGTGVRMVGSGLDDVLASAVSAAPDAKSIVVDLRVAAADPSGASAKAIRALPAASGLSFDAFYDATLTKAVDGVMTDVGSTNDALIGVAYPFEFSGKDQVRVFASHAGQAYEITSAPNADGEYAALDRAAGTVTVYAKRYSTFGIGYTAAPGSTPVSVVTPASASAASPATGDPAAPALPVALALAGLACLGLVAARRRRER